MNGTDFISTVTNNAVTSSVPYRLNVTAIYKLNVNDYVELHVYQDSSSPLNVINESKTSPVFGMVKVG